ncbi:MAG: hypothetical protein EAZ34_03210 [Polaromonas sp.]|nr:MAG: hypothetical protein EAZ34_03210 [Polaromonas sp.]
MGQFMPSVSKLKSNNQKRLYGFFYKDCTLLKQELASSGVRAVAAVTVQLRVAHVVAMSGMARHQGASASLWRGCGSRVGMDYKAWSRKKRSRLPESG